MDIVTVVIVLRKDVADETAARNVIDLVKTKMADHPEVTVSAKISTAVDTSS